MTIYGATRSIAEILSLERALVEVARARDVSLGNKEVEEAWRILDHRRQELIKALGPDEDWLLERARAEHKEWEKKIEAMMGSRLGLN